MFEPVGKRLYGWREEREEKRRGSRRGRRKKRRREEEEEEDQPSAADHRSGVCSAADPCEPTSLCCLSDVTSGEVCK